MVTRGNLLLTAALTIALTGTLAAVKPRSAEYAGSEACKSCHAATHKALVDGSASTRHARTLRKADEKGAIIGDFVSKEPHFDVHGVVMRPKLTAFTREQVEWVVGSGRTGQSYLDKDSRVLPAKWDVRSTAWQKAEPIDAAKGCLGCHSTGFDASTGTYAEAGVGCEACHGAGAAHAGKPSKGNIMNPKNIDEAKRSMICGQCHSAGKDSSGALPFPVGFQPGDDLNKAFVDAKPSAPGKNQQYSEHILGKHAKAGVGCTDCHNSHNESGIKGQLTKSRSELCVACHAQQKTAGHAPGAEEGSSCVKCHMPDGSHTFLKAK